jgi:hypothetical protein
VSILTVGDKFPEFELTALKGGDLHEANAQSPDDYFETPRTSRVCRSRCSPTSPTT